MEDIKVRLSALWVFVLFNYLWCDVLGLFALATPDRLSAEGLLAASVLMEIPVAMALVSRLWRHPASRWLNVAAALFMTLVQVSTLFVGTATTSYVLFSAIEIAGLLLVAWTALRWNGRPSDRGVVA
jgi:hypothetical protein